MERENGSNGTCCLACLLFSFCLVSLFVPVFFPSPPAFYRYLPPRLRVVSSVKQLSVPLDHVCCYSLSDLLASHSSELLSAFVFFLSYTGISFLVFVLFRPCSSCLFLFSCSSCNLYDLHHILQNSCRLFCRFSSYFCYFSGLACLLCSRTRYASISFA